jgi:hypothetical protein
MAWAPSTDDLLDLRGVGQRIDGFEFLLLDTTGSVAGELHPSRDNVPTVSNDSARSVRRQLSNMRLLPDEVADVDPLGSSILARMFLENGERFNLGVFLLGDRSNVRHSWGTERSVTWSDKSTLLNQPTTKSVGWGKGADIALAMVGIAIEVLDLSDFGDGPPSDAVFGAPVAYPPGTNRLKIMEDFSRLLGWLPPFFDRDGLLRFVEIPDLNMDAPTVPGYGPGTRIHAESIVPSDTLLDAPNQFVVVESSGRSNIRGVYNVSDAAPHSAANRNGRIIPMVKQVQGLSSTTQANKAARALAVTERRGIFRTTAFDGTADPRHDTNDLVPFRETLDESYITWLELDWTLPCIAGASHQHHLRRVY